MEWYCCLLREGTSDDPLAESLQKLLVSLTGDPVTMTIGPGRQSGAHRQPVDQNADYVSHILAGVRTLGA